MAHRIKTTLDDGKRRLTVTVELESRRPPARDVVETEGVAVDEAPPSARAIRPLAKCGVVVPLRRVGAR